MTIYDATVTITLTESFDVEIEDPAAWDHPERVATDRAESWVRGDLKGGQIDARSFDIDVSVEEVDE